MAVVTLDWLGVFSTDVFDEIRIGQQDWVTRYASCGLIEPFEQREVCTSRTKRSLQCRPVQSFVEDSSDPSHNAAYEPTTVFHANARRVPYRGANRVPRGS